jgi:hypothetical protein
MHGTSSIMANMRLIFISHLRQLSPSMPPALITLGNFMLSIHPLLMVATFGPLVRYLSHPLSELGVVLTFMVAAIEELSLEDGCFLSITQLSVTVLDLASHRNDRQNACTFITTNFVFVIPLSDDGPDSRVALTGHLPSPLKLIGWMGYELSIDADVSIPAVLCHSILSCL